MNKTPYGSAEHGRAVNRAAHPDSHRVALAASLQALYVLASRVASCPDSPSVITLLESLASSLSPCLAIAVRSAGNPDALRECLQIPHSVARHMDQGWAMALGENRIRLRAPGTLSDIAWQPRLRTRPIISTLSKTNDGHQMKEAPVAEADLHVIPIAHPDGHLARPLRLADELARPAALADAWTSLVSGASAMPVLKHLSDLDHWLWHFDAFLNHFLHGIPAYWEGLQNATSIAATRDTLYDQSRIAGAIAIALIHFHGTPRDDRGHQSKPPREILLIAGEMEPIQDYIFGFTPNTPVPIDLLLRGRSSFLRLVVDIAAYRICEELGLPPGCIIMSAASKFTILAPNTAFCRDAVERLQCEFDQWALQALYGQTSVRLAQSASMIMMLENTCKDETGWTNKGHPHKGVSGTFSELAKQSGHSGLRRFQLCADPSEPVGSTAIETPPLYLSQFQERMRANRICCAVDARTPATATRLGWPLSAAAAFQLDLATALVAETPTVRLVRNDGDAPAIREDESMDILGYRVLVQCLPAPIPVGGSSMHWELRRWSDSLNQIRWSGLCHKSLAVYSQAEPAIGPVTQLRQVLKGDIDHFGIAFRDRIPNRNLGRFAVLSREVETFFSVVVPCQLAKRFPDVITILSGGDDFIFVGPSRSLLSLSVWLHEAFETFCGGKLWMSCGLSDPFRRESYLGSAVAQADDALALAKITRDKVTAFGESLSWTDWITVLDLASTAPRSLPRAMREEDLSAPLFQILNGSPGAIQAIDRLRNQVGTLSGPSVSRPNDVASRLSESDIRDAREWLRRLTAADPEQALAAYAILIAFIHASPQPGALRDLIETLRNAARADVALVTPPEQSLAV